MIGLQDSSQGSCSVKSAICPVPSCLCRCARSSRILNTACVFVGSTRFISGSSRVVSGVGIVPGTGSIPSSATRVCFLPFISTIANAIFVSSTLQNERRVSRIWSAEIKPLSEVILGSFELAGFSIFCIVESRMNTRKIFSLAKSMLLKTFDYRLC